MQKACNRHECAQCGRELEPGHTRSEAHSPRGRRNSRSPPPPETAGLMGAGVEPAVNTHTGPQPGAAIQTGPYTPLIQPIDSRIYQRLSHRHFARCECTAFIQLAFGLQEWMSWSAVLRAWASMSLNVIVQECRDLTVLKRWKIITQGLCRRQPQGLMGAGSQPDLRSPAELARRYRLPDPGGRQPLENFGFHPANRWGYDLRRIKPGRKLLSS